MVNQHPEQESRDIIDRKLEQAGWFVQDRDQTNFGKGRAVAVREYLTDTGPADYVLFVDKKTLGVIEAKRPEEEYRITKTEEHSSIYAVDELKNIGAVDLPFLRARTNRPGNRVTPLYCRSGGTNHQGESAKSRSAQAERVEEGVLMGS